MNKASPTCLLVLPWAIASGETQLAEHAGRPTQLAQRRLRLLRHEGLTARVGERRDRLRLRGGFGYLRQRARAAADVCVTPLFGEQGGHPLQDLHAVVPFLSLRQASEYLPGPVRGLAVSACGIVKDAQAPRGKQLHRRELDPGGDQVAFQQMLAGRLGRSPHRLDQAEQAIGHRQGPAVPWPTRVRRRRRRPCGPSRPG
jgi:hypothetical protein